MDGFSLSLDYPGLIKNPLNSIAYSVISYYYYITKRYLMMSDKTFNRLSVSRLPYDIIISIQRFVICKHSLVCDGELQ